MGFVVTLTDKAGGERTNYIEEADAGDCHDRPNRRQTEIADISGKVGGDERNKH